MSPLYFIPCINPLAKMGVEPIRPFGQGILNPQRLPFRHSADDDLNMLFRLVIIFADMLNARYFLFGVVDSTIG
jgi:hypothetical protein